MTNLLNLDVGIHKDFSENKSERNFLFKYDIIVNVFKILNLDRNLDWIWCLMIGKLPAALIILLKMLEQFPFLSFEKFVNWDKLFEKTYCQYIPQIVTSKRTFPRFVERYVLSYFIICVSLQ